MTDQDVERFLRNDPVTLALYRRKRQRGQSVQAAWQELLQIRPDLQRVNGASTPTRIILY